MFVNVKILIVINLNIDRCENTDVLSGSNITALLGQNNPLEPIFKGNKQINYCDYQPGANHESLNNIGGIEFVGGGDINDRRINLKHVVSKIKRF